MATVITIRKMQNIYKLEFLYKRKQREILLNLTFISKLFKATNVLYNIE